MQWKTYSNVQDILNLCFPYKSPNDLDFERDFSFDKKNRSVSDQSRYSRNESEDTDPFRNTHKEDGESGTSS